MKIKVFIEDGVVMSVMGDADAVRSDAKIHIVNFDSDYDDRDLLKAEYDEDGMAEMRFEGVECGQRAG